MLQLINSPLNAVRVATILNFEVELATLLRRQFKKVPPVVNYSHHHFVLRFLWYFNTKFSLPSCSGRAFMAGYFIGVHMFIEFK